MGDESIAGSKTKTAPQHVEENLAEVVIRNLRKRGQSAYIQKIIHEIKAVADNGSSVRVSSSYPDVREILAKHGCYFAHELCEACHGSANDIMQLPPSFRNADDDPVDEEAEAEYVHPLTRSHHDQKELMTLPALSKKGLCTMCGEKPRCGKVCLDQAWAGGCQACFLIVLILSDPH